MVHASFARTKFISQIPERFETLLRNIGIPFLSFRQFVFFTVLFFVFQLSFSFNIGGNHHDHESSSTAYAADTLNAVLIDDATVSNGVYIPVQPTTERTIHKYIVQGGDTVTAIAEKYDVSVDTIIAANDIVGGVIQPGMELKVPWTTGVIEVVGKGATLGKIAAKYKDAGISEKIILRANGLETDTLAVGQELLIPGVDPIIRSVSRNPSYVDGGRSGGYAPASKAPLVKGNGKFVRPASGKVTQRFRSGGHTGEDIANKKGTPVVAADAGTVIKAATSGWNGGYGLHVVIEHSDGARTLYGHASRLNVKVGDTVVAGQQIMEMGSTGRSTGPHVHFEVQVPNASGKYVKVNPDSYL